MWVIWLAWFVGILVGVRTLMARAGLDWLHGMPVSQIMASPGWFFIMMGKSIGWPITLVIWLVQGQPPSPWQVSAGRFGRVVRVPPANRVRP